MRRGPCRLCQKVRQWLGLGGKSIRAMTPGELYRAQGFPVPPTHHQKAAGTRRPAKQPRRK